MSAGISTPQKPQMPRRTRERTQEGLNKLLASHLPEILQDLDPQPEATEGA